MIEQTMTPKGVDGRSMDALQDLYAPIGEELRREERLLRELLSCDHEFIAAMLDHTAKMRGKRLRSAMLFLCARICGGTRDEHVSLAAIVELIHLATLAHDDVLDEADKRRLAESLNAHWGNEASVLFGDYLFAKSFALCAQLKMNDVTSLLAKTTEKICIGELSQIARKFDLGMGEDEYYRIIELKTAELFSTACLFGTVGRPSDADLKRKLSAFGLNVGKAFQIIDDHLDIVGDEARVGKPLGGDLAKGKMTLPVIRLLNILPAKEKERLTATLSTPGGNAEKRAMARELMEEYDISRYTMGKARLFIDLANREIQDVDSPSVHALQKLAVFTVERHL